MLEINYPLAYGIRSRDKKIVKTSSSGGIFSEIANYFINNKGIVYAVIIDEEIRAVYLRGTTVEDIEKMRTSKYVQADIKGIKEKLTIDLNNNKKVLFVGTPCYVNYILKNLTDKEKKNLTTIDFICHGTPNQSIFADHINYLETLYGKKAVYYSFRNKRFGWSHDEFIKFEDNSQKSSVKEVGRFGRLFHSGYSLNLGCFSCKFTSKIRKSDLTIGDFWGVEEVLKIYDNKGMSCLLINNEKGKKIFENVKNNLYFFEVDLDDVHQQALYAPTKKPKKYDEFWKEYNKYGYKTVTEKYVSATKKEILSVYRRRIVHILKLDKLAFTLKYKLKGVLK